MNIINDGNITNSIVPYLENICLEKFSVNLLYISAWNKWTIKTENQKQSHQYFFSYALVDHSCERTTSSQIYKKNVTHTYERI